MQNLSPVTERTATSTTWTSVGKSARRNVATSRLFRPARWRRTEMWRRWLEDIRTRRYGNVRCFSSHCLSVLSYELKWSFNPPLFLFSTDTQMEIWLWFIQKATGAPLASRGWPSSTLSANRMHVRLNPHCRRVLLHAELLHIWFIVGLFSAANGGRGNPVFAGETDCTYYFTWETAFACVKEKEDILCRTRDGSKHYDLSPLTRYPG